MELAACLHLRKAPLDCCMGMIAPMLPHAGFFGPRLLIGNAAISTLFRPRRQLDFGPIEPTTFVRRLVQCKLLGNVKGLLRRHYLRERSWRMGVQVILNEANTGRCGGIPLRQGVHKLGRIQRSTSGAHFERANAALGGEGQQHTAGAMPCVCRIITQRPSRRHRQRHQDVAQALTGTRVKAQSRAARDHTGRHIASGRLPYARDSPRSASPYPSVSCARVCVDFFSRLAPTCNTDGVDDVQGDQRIGDQLQGPARLPLRRVGAGNHRDLGFDARVDCEGLPTARLLLQRSKMEAEVFWQYFLRIL